MKLYPKFKLGGILRMQPGGQVPSDLITIDGVPATYIDGAWYRGNMLPEVTVEGQDLTPIVADKAYPYRQIFPTFRYSRTPSGKTFYGRQGTEHVLVFKDPKIKQLYKTNPSEFNRYMIANPKSVIIKTIVTDPYNKEKATYYNFYRTEQNPYIADYGGKEVSPGYYFLPAEPRNSNPEAEKLYYTYLK